MIVALTYFTSLMVILTKWFDCTTTLKHIHGIAMETNPIARALMNRFGIKGTVWFAFVASIVVTVLSQLYVQLCFMRKKPTLKQRVLSHTLLFTHPDI